MDKYVLLMVILFLFVLFRQMDPYVIPTTTNITQIIQANPSIPGSIMDGPIAQSVVHSAVFSSYTKDGDLIFVDVFDGNLGISSIRKLSNGVVTTLYSTYAKITAMCVGPAAVLSGVTNRTILWNEYTGNTNSFKRMYIPSGNLITITNFDYSLINPLDISTPTNIPDNVHVGIMSLAFDIGNPTWVYVQANNGALYAQSVGNLSMIVKIDNQVGRFVDICAASRSQYLGIYGIYNNQIYAVGAAYASQAVWQSVPPNVGYQIGTVNSVVAGAAGSTTLVDGTGANARFKKAHSIACMQQNYVYVADYDNNGRAVIRVISYPYSPSVAVSTMNQIFVGPLKLSVSMNSNSSVALLVYDYGTNILSSII